MDYSKLIEEGCARIYGPAAVKKMTIYFAGIFCREMWVIRVREGSVARGLVF